MSKLSLPDEQVPYSISANDYNLAEGTNLLHVI